MTIIPSMKKLTTVKFLLILYLFGVFSIQGQEISKRNDLQTISDKTVNVQVSEIKGKRVNLPKFKYVEIYNGLYTRVLRHIDVYLEEKWFTEENLKTLFEYVSKRNPAPNYLTISVYTNRMQFDPCYNKPKDRGDCSGVLISERPDRPDEYDYYQATYWRRKNREYFKYSQELKIHASQFKRVLIKNN